VKEYAYEDVSRPKLESLVTHAFGTEIHVDSVDINVCFDENLPTSAHEEDSQLSPEVTDSLQSHEHRDAPLNPRTQVRYRLTAFFGHKRLLRKIWRGSRRRREGAGSRGGVALPRIWE